MKVKDIEEVLEKVGIEEVLEKVSRMPVEPDAEDFETAREFVDRVSAETGKAPPPGVVRLVAKMHKLGRMYEQETGQPAPFRRLRRLH